MAEHNKLGKDAEEMATQWIIQNGYLILHRNWCYKHFELDIVATKNNFIHFFEVKARNYSRFGYPEDAVRKKKFKNLQRAANEYLHLYPGHKWIQYNILAITLFRYKEPEFFLLEDVFL